MFKILNIFILICLSSRLISQEVCSKYETEYAKLKSEVMELDTISITVQLSEEEKTIIRNIQKLTFCELMKKIGAKVYNYDTKLIEFEMLIKRIQFYRQLNQINE